MNKAEKTNTRVKNILDELEVIGEKQLREDLSSFSCRINPKIENFVHNRAIRFRAQESLSNISGERFR